MGYYIEVPKATNKAQQIITLYNAERVTRPNSFSEIPNDKALICVIQNGFSTPQD